MGILSPQTAGGRAPHTPRDKSGWGEALGGRWTNLYLPVPTSHKHSSASLDVPALGSGFPETHQRHFPSPQCSQKPTAVLPQLTPGSWPPTLTPDTKPDSEFLLKTWGGEKEVKVSHLVGAQGEAWGCTERGAVGSPRLPPGDSAGLGCGLPGALNTSNRGQKSTAAYFPNPRGLQDPQSRHSELPLRAPLDATLRPTRAGQWLA